MNKLWKQKNAVDQLKAIRASLAGHLSNYNDFIIGNPQFCRHLEQHLDQIEELEPYLAGKSWEQPMEADAVSQNIRLEKAVHVALGQNDDYALHVRHENETVFFKLTNVVSGRTSEESKTDLKTWQRALLSGLIT
jgi:hypothetical protein